MTLIQLRGVTRTVLLGDGSPLHILRGVNLDVQAGEYVSIVGRSGTGKTTLLNILGLLDTPTGGEYFINGVPVRQMSERRRTLARGKGFGFVFQHFNLLPGRTALENTTAPLMYADGTKFWRRSAIATDLLTRVGLGERLDSLPTQLSGGEAQRVAIARALVRDPRIILCDEPTGALDVDSGNDIMNMLRDVAADLGAALIVITHDLAIASRADTHYSLSDGVLHRVQISPRESATLDDLDAPTDAAYAVDVLDAQPESELDPAAETELDPAGEPVTVPAPIPLAEELGVGISEERGEQ